MEESSFKKIFSNPYINLISILLGLIGLVLGIYFYLQSKENRELVYSINPSKALVVDSKKASNMQVLFDGKIISSDIVAVQIAVWNHGKKSIKKGDFLQVIKITTNDSLKILETSIRKISRKVTNFTIVKNSFDNKSILLDWDILEHDDGAIIQILYSGKLDSRFYLDGAFEGQSTLNEIEIYDSDLRQFPYALLIGGIILLSLGFLFKYKIKKNREIRKIEFNRIFPNKKFPIHYDKEDIILKIISLYLPIIPIIIGLYLLISSPPIVPFSF